MVISNCGSFRAPPVQASNSIIIELPPVPHVDDSGANVITIALPSRINTSLTTLSPVFGRQYVEV